MEVVKNAKQFPKILLAEVFETLTSGNRLLQLTTTLMKLSRTSKNLSWESLEKKNLNWYISEEEICTLNQSFSFRHKLGKKLERLRMSRVKLNVAFCRSLPSLNWVSENGNSPVLSKFVFILYLKRSAAAKGIYRKTGSETA